LLQSETAQLEQWPIVLDRIYKIAQNIPWLREECGMMLCDFVKTLAASKSEPDSYVSKMLESLDSHELSKTPEGIAIWITIKSRFSDLELPQKIWKKNDPLCTKERSAFVKAMTESVAQEPVDPESNGKGTNGKNKKSQAPKVKTGTWQPKPNFAWDLVLQEAIKTFPKASKFQQFWLELVDSKRNPFHFQLHRDIS
jgi:DNA polymerase phi